MNVFAVVGPSDLGKTTAVEMLARRLRTRGEVATVKRLTHEPDIDTDGKDTARHRASGASHATGLTDDGTWFATGEGWSLDGVLDDLAPDYAYVVVEGFSETDLPKVALGDRSVAEPVIATAPDADALDVDAVLAAVEDAPERETLASLVARTKESADSEFAGAVATFTGRVRERDDSDDAPTGHLEFERYDAVADQRMAAIREELRAREGVYDVRMHYRTGVVPAGEDVVYVVVLAGHREEAFQAVSDGIDRLKDEVPLFKKEVTVDEAFWRHEQPQ